MSGDEVPQRCSGCGKPIGPDATDTVTRPGRATMVDDFDGKSAVEGFDRLYHARCAP